MPPKSRRPREVQRDVDRWFREQGLPTFVPLRYWFADLARRVAPLVVWATLVLTLAGDGAEVLTLAVAALSRDHGAIIAIVLVTFLLLALGAAWGAFLVVRSALRRLPVGTGTRFAVVLLGACAALIIVAGYLGEQRPDGTPVVLALCVLAVCILVTGIGGGELISWASHLAVRNASAIGHMASIALPVILMLVVFAFFSAEVWQMASALHWGSITLVGLVVAVLAGIVVLRVSASEIDDDAQAPTDEQRAALLVDTPGEGRSLAPGSRPRLRAPQRINILLAMTVAQLMQALFFAALLAALLVVIGGIAIPSEVIAIWLGPGGATQPLLVEPLEFFGARLPLSVNLLKAAVLLAVIATLPFVFSAVSEPRYRERFFDPIMVDMRRAILVRDAVGTTPDH